MHNKCSIKWFSTQLVNSFSRHAALRITTDLNTLKYIYNNDT